MSGADKWKPVGKMTLEEMEEEVVRRSMSVLLQAFRHFDSVKGIKNKDPKIKVSTAKIILERWSNKEFRNLIQTLKKNQNGKGEVVEEVKKGVEVSVPVKAEFQQ